jgi:hypothetical protein
VKRARVLLALSPFAFPVVLPAAIRVALAQAPPRAGTPRPSAAVRLATLAERVAKLDAQIAQGVLVARSRRAMVETIRDFEAQHRALLSGTTAPDLREHLQLLALLWQDYRAWAARPPTRDNARKLGERTEEVVWVAMKAARFMHGAPRAAADMLAFKAAEACMLSQRIPRLHLWRRWGIRDESLLNELRLSEAQLHATLDSLRAVATNAPEITSELQVAESQAAFLAQASRQLEGGKDAQRHLEYIAKSGDHILESMDRVTRLYDDSALR